MVFPCSRSSALAALLLLASPILSEPVPAAVKAFKDSIIAKGKCAQPLNDKFFNSALEEPTSEFAYCGDALATNNVVYLQGPGGQLANMDIDCDGDQDFGGDDRCGKSTTTQTGTSFQSVVKGYGVKGVENLNSIKHSYVVFGNTGSKFAELDPEEFGIEPLSVMAVVCGDKMFYGVWGDENGDNMEKPVVGEASISLATACFGKSMTGGNGHGENDVLYLSFPGSDAVPGAKGAKWDAQNFEEFHASIKPLGDKLIQRISGGAAVAGRPEEIEDGNENKEPGTTTTVMATKTGSQDSPTDKPKSGPKKQGGAQGKEGSKSKSEGTCSWEGHCAGATCSTENDCSDDLVCVSGKCGAMA